MASNIKYAQNLIGDWDRDIYEPKKQILQDIYQTNWTKLSNDYNTLKDTLARNYDVARQTYNNTLGDIQNESFNRMNAANIDLASRGLSSSGVTNLVNNADTQVKGEEVNKALSSLLNTEAGVEKGLYSGLNTLGQQENSLASVLLGDIGGLTDADAANMQQYAGLVGNIAESAASRAASRAASGGGKETNDEDELDRRLAIAETLESEDYTDDEKINLLVRHLNVPLDNAKSAVSAYNYDKTNIAMKAAQEKLDTYISRNRLNPDLYTLKPQIVLNNRDGNAITRYRANNLLDKVSNLNRNLSNYTYGDIYDILYGGK